MSFGEIKLERKLDLEYISVSHKKRMILGLEEGKEAPS